MKLKTTRFGMLDVPEENVLHFPEGIIGFENCKRFVILSKKDNAPLRWLQAVDEPGLAFIIINPYLFKPDYRPRLERQDMNMLKLKDISEAELLTIVVVPENPRDMVANLMAPIVINTKLCIGKQAIIKDASYPTRYKILANDGDSAEHTQVVSC